MTRKVRKIKFIWYVCSNNCINFHCGFGHNGLMRNNVKDKVIPAINSTPHHEKGRILHSV
jgi:hypothetical protein